MTDAEMFEQLARDFRIMRTLWGDARSEMDAEDMTDLAMFAEGVFERASMMQTALTQRSTVEDVITWTRIYADAVSVLARLGAAEPKRQAPDAIGACLDALGVFIDNYEATARAAA